MGDGRPGSVRGNQAEGSGVMIDESRSNALAECKRQLRRVMLVEVAAIGLVALLIGLAAAFLR